MSKYLEDHVYIDKKNIKHLFIRYSYGGIRVFDIPFDKDTFVCRYGLDTGTVIIPNYHPLTNIIKDNPDKTFTCSLQSMHIIIIYLDDHPSRNKMFKVNEYAKYFNSVAIECLHHIAEFATLYHIDSLFDYIRDLLTLSTNFVLYPSKLKTIMSNLKPAEVKEMLKKIIVESGEKMDVEQVYANIFHYTLVKHSYIAFLKGNKYFKSKSIKDAANKICYSLLDDVKLPERVPINDIYILINMADKPVGVISKFLAYFLKYTKHCKLDLSKYKELHDDFKIYQSIQLPKDLLQLLQLNLLILSTNNYNKTPINYNYIYPEETLQI